MTSSSLVTLSRSKSAPHPHNGDDRPGVLADRLLDHLLEFSSVSARSKYQDHSSRSRYSDVADNGARIFRRDTLSHRTKNDSVSPASTRLDQDHLTPRLLSVVGDVGGPFLPRAHLLFLFSLVFALACSSFMDFLDHSG